MAREINIPEQEIIVQVAQTVTVTTDKISINTVTDTGESVTTNISFFSSTGVTETLTLWEGASYIAIGNWTDADVNTRILELI